MTEASIDIETIVKRIADGDQNQIGALYDQTIYRVYRTLNFLAKNKSDLDDLTQEVYVHLYNHVDSYDSSRSFEAWLIGHALEQTSHHKSNARGSVISAPKVDDTAPQLKRSVGLDHPDQGIGQYILARLEQLSMSQRQVVVLHYLNDYSDAQIAEILDEPLGTVQGRLQKAISALIGDHTSGTEDVCNDNDIQQILRDAAKELHPPDTLKDEIMKKFQRDRDDRPTKSNVDSETPPDPVTDVRHELHAGTGKAVYVVDSNPERTISYEMVYEAVPWEKGLDELMDVMNPNRFKVIRDAEIKQISVVYGFQSLTNYEVEEMYRVADITGSQLVTKDLRQGEKIIGGEISYTRGSQTITVTMMNPQSLIHLTNLDHRHGEHVRAGSVEGLFSSDGKHNRLVWTEGRPVPLRYDLRTGANLSKQEVVDLAASMVFAE